jgi:predicted O-methyltransferase YrrM
METLKINYNSNISELCVIGSNYDTDKSSQRQNVSDSRHCHPYTLFYDGLFRNKKHEKLKMAELGILEGGSLRMWQEYFENTEIYGFEYADHYINHYKDNFNMDRITLSKIDVTSQQSISQTFSELDIQYDIIIEDTTHQFEDQIRVIENTYTFLKPGGVMIIEDVFKSYDEKDYLERLKPILHHFQDSYFVELDHVNRVSTGWNNDKLFILVKGGAEPIFKNENKLTIITPSYRVDNLLSIKNSIDFAHVEEWIIVYDGSKITENPKLFAADEHGNKIKEYVHHGEGISGNPQRNYALTKISNPDTFLYYLDDDNIIHPSLFHLVKVMDKNKMYTFNLYKGLRGNNVNVKFIDTAMFMIHYPLCAGITWDKHKYDADGFYIRECYVTHQQNHVFVDNELCYYNKMSAQN